MRLDSWPTSTNGRITAIEWAALSEAEAHRLRDLGFNADTEIEVLHRGRFLFRDRLAVRIGRMTVAMRAKQASAIEVEAA